MKNPAQNLSIIGAVLLLVIGAACGGGEAVAPATTETVAGASAVAPTSGEGDSAQAAQGVPLDTALFSTVLPDGWEIMADDLANMGMMTLAKKGTGGATGVYLKFEGGGSWDGDPMKEVEAFATKQEGTPAELATLNGIEWAKTSYEAFGTKQVMFVTKHNGTKVTATVMGDAESPEVKEILDSFKLK